MTHAQIRRALAEGITRTLAANALPVSLYDYQRETLEATARWLQRRGSHSRGYIAQATGLGKTVEYATIVKACEGLRALVIVPTKILVAQSIKDLADFTEGSMAHASSLKEVTDGSGEVLAAHWCGQRHDVLVTTDETFKAKSSFIKSELDPHVIIWDECHWSYSDKAQAALAVFPNAVVIGLSATPDFLTTTAKSDYIPVTLDNGQVLYCPPTRLARTYYPELIDERGVRWGIQNRHLAALAWGQLDFTLRLEDVPTVDGPGGVDFDQGELQRVMRQQWGFVVQVIRKLYQSGQYGLARRFSAAVCPGINQAEVLAEELRSIGLAAEVISERTRDNDRMKILEKGRHGDLQFLSSIFALREGWNSPNAEVAMMLRPTKSRVLYMQFMGRVLRRFGDKVALVLDPHYQNLRFAPLSAPVLFGTPGQAVRKGGILVGLRDDDGEGGGVAISPYDLGQLEPVLTIEPIEIEYWAGEDGTFEADGETWVNLSSGARILKISDKTLVRRVNSCRTREAKDSYGRIRTFYALSDVRAACADLMSTTDQAGEDGTFEADGETWVTTESGSRIVKVSKSGIALRVHSCRSRQGKDGSGRPCTFYALSDVRAACADLMSTTDQAGEDGTFEADGETWATVRPAGKLLGLGAKAITPRLRLCRTRQGKDRSGHVCTFYALSDLRKACVDVRRSKKKK